MSKGIPKKSSIFLSHTHADKEFAHRLAADLQWLGIQVWIDDAEIKIGDTLIDKIGDGIGKMEYLGVLLSSKSVNSQWVSKEVQIAMNEEIEGGRVKVLPLLIDDCDLPIFLKGKLYADFRTPEAYEAEFTKLALRLGAKPENIHSIFRLPNIRTVFPSIPEPDIKLELSDSSKLVGCYLQDMTIEDPKMLATLTVLFDRIWFPPNAFRPLAPGAADNLTGTLSLTPQMYKWFMNCRLLFKEGVLRRLELPEIDLVRGDLVEIEKAAKDKQKTIEKRAEDNYMGSFLFLKEITMGILHRHIIRRGTELFISDGNEATSINLSGLMEYSLIDIKFPQLNDLSPEQIMEVRESVKDLRADLSDFVATFKNDVKLKSVRRDSTVNSSSKTIKINLLPQYDDFVECLSSKQTGWRSKVVAENGKFLRLVFKRWDSQVYREFMSTAADLMQKMSEEDIRLLTGQEQAFQFVGRLESKH